MKAQLKTLLTSFLLLIAMCVGAFASVSEKHVLGDFEATQQYLDQNPQANQLASLESFGFYQKHASECCNATNNGPDLTKFSTQDRKSYNTLERRIVEHEQKLADFKANPTVRPGMENQPLDVIRTAQERRVLHLEREIAAFRKNQSDIVSNYE